MDKIYQIKIQLLGIDPLIWRRFVVPSGLPLIDFHKAIQTIMGWQNYHLHQFIKDNKYYLPKMRDDWTWEDETNVDTRGLKVSDILKVENEEIIYEYDMGDSWGHLVVLENIADNLNGLKKPFCLEGERNCPPEDCGGFPGYENLLEILSDPDHEEYESYLEWLGGEFDPELFSERKVNGRLKRMKFGG